MALSGEERSLSGEDSPYERGMPRVSNANWRPLADYRCATRRSALIREVRTPSSLDLGKRCSR